MIFGSIIFARGSVENKFIYAIISILKFGYVSAFFFVLYVYLCKTQDSGFVRQQVALLSFFVLAFPVSIFVYFWIVLPLLIVNYFLPSMSHYMVGGTIFDDIFILFTGLANGRAGYRQWFVLFPKIIRMFKYCRANSSSTAQPEKTQLEVFSSTGISRSSDQGKPE